MCIRDRSGEVEIMDGTFEFVDDGEEFIAEPVDVTELLGTDELINHQNEFVSFTGLTVEPAAEGSDAAFLYSYDGSGSDGDDLYFNASYNGQTYTFTVESYLCDNTTDVYLSLIHIFPSTSLREESGTAGFTSGMRQYFPRRAFPIRKSGPACGRKDFCCRRTAP